MKTLIFLIFLLFVAAVFTPFAALFLLLVFVTVRLATPRPRISR